MKRNSNKSSAQFQNVSFGRDQYAGAQAVSLEDITVDLSGTLPGRFRLPPLDRTDPEYERKRDERLGAFFAALERTLVPEPRPMSEIKKKIMETPIGIAPK
jgi:hypothetical protein